MLKRTLVLAGVFLGLFVGVSQAAGVTGLNQTISSNTAATYSLTVNFTGLIDDIYIQYPGADSAASYAIYHTYTGQNVATGTFGFDGALRDNLAEVNDVDTWIASGTVIKVWVDKASTATGTTLRVVLFYKEP